MTDIDAAEVLEKEIENLVYTLGRLTMLHRTLNAECNDSIYQNIIALQNLITALEKMAKCLRDEE